MSKESSIKVFAENFSGSDKPVNAISVWLENASDIPGGGGSIPSTVSGKWEDASDCVQTNSGTWGQGGSSIPSAFVVSADGQAYKAIETTGGMADIPYQDNFAAYGSTEYLKNKFENKLDNLYVISSPNNIQKIWIDYKEDGENLQEITSGGNTITSFYLDKTKFNDSLDVNSLYIIGSTDVNDDWPVPPDHPVNAAIQLQTETEGGTTLVPYLLSGYDKSCFTIIPGVTTNAEVNTNSANGLRLYNSADGLTYDYAGVVQHGEYDTLNFKAISGRNYTIDLQKNIRMNIVPESTSACTILDTHTTNLLNENSTVPIPTDLSANNITANDSVVVGKFEQDEWGINISGIQFNTASININPRYTQSEVGYIALTSRKPNQYWQETTAEANINAFDWNKLMEVYNIVSTNSGNW